MKSWFSCLARLGLVFPLLGASPLPGNDTFYWSGTLEKDGTVLKELSGQGEHGVAHIQLTTHKSCDLTFQENRDMMRGVLKCHRDYVLFSLTFYSQYIKKGQSPLFFETPKGRVKINIAR